MDRYNPVLMVRASGWNITHPSNPLVTDFEHKELGDGGKEAKVTVANASYDLLDNPKLQEGVTLEWRFGYPGSLSPVYKAKIHVVEPTFDAFSGLTLRLYAYDAIVETLFTKRRKAWRKGGEAKILRSEVVEMIAADLGMTAEVEKTKHYKTEFPQSESDWEFLQKLASEAVAENSEKNGAYRVWFDEQSQKIYFKPAPFDKAPKQTYTFLFESQDPVLITFAPKIDTSKKAGAGGDSVNSSGQDGEGNDLDGESTAEDANRQKPEGSTEILRGEYLDSTTTRPGEVRDTPDAADPAVEDPDELAEDQADSRLAEQELDAVEAQITLIGDPFIRANDIVEIRRVGQRLSGPYLCDEVVHKIGMGGFTTNITGKRSLVSGEDGSQAEGGTEGGTEPAEDENDEQEIIDIRGEDYEMPSGGR